MEEVGKWIIKGLIVGAASMLGKEAASAAIEAVKNF